MDGTTWMRALCFRAGNVATQCAKWRRCVNTGSCTTRVFVTTCAFTFAISAWMRNWSREQTSNSASNSANLERRLLKWYDVHMEMRPLCRAMCFEWHARFKRGRTSLEDNERSGRPSTSSTPKNVETIKWLVHKDRWRTIKDIAAIVNVSYGTKKTWTVVCRQSAAPWWQHTLLFSSRNTWVSRPQLHYHMSASTLLARFGPLRLLPLPEDEAEAKGSPIWRVGGDPAGIAGCAWYA